MMDHGFLLTSDKIAHRLRLIEQNLFQRALNLPSWNYHRLDFPPERKTGIPTSRSPGWEAIEPHSYWGEWRTNFALKTEFHIPGDWPSSEFLQLYLPLGEAGDFFSHPEILLTVEGRRLGAADRHHQIIQLPTGLPKRRALRCEATGWTGLSSWPPEDGLRTRPYMRPCLLVQRHRTAFAFVNHARAALETARLESADKTTCTAILDALHHALLAVDLTEPLGQEKYFASFPRALGYLKNGLAQAGPPLMTSIHAIGHAHIDVAYLWQLEQTRGKLRRTFSNALALMEADDEFCFTQTTPLLYQLCKEDDPAMFDEVKMRVRQGRWEAATAMWVECDCNLTGGESLIRQLRLARQFNDLVLEGRDSRVLFLPDTFGFCASLPQLVRQAGIDCFVFSKLNWNQTNRFPHSFFEWEGIDGTRLFSHLLTTPREVAYLPTASTYKAEMTAREVIGSVLRCTQPEMPVMVAFGYGDGGGGPNDILVANAHAYMKMPSQPRLRFSRLDLFMRDARGQAGELPVHRGELYLELHRGTYTSQAKIKRANRKLEARLLETEAMCALSAWYNHACYPASDLTTLWQRFCTNQFHDILPGSAIASVIDDAMRDYQEIDSRLLQLFQGALAQFGATRQHQAGQWTIINAGPVSHSGTVTLTNMSMETGAVPERRFPQAQRLCQPLIVQTSPLSAWSTTMMEDGSALAQNDGHDLAIYWANGLLLLENEWICAAIDDNGLLSSFRHKDYGEMLLQGQKGNQLVAFEDRPLMWDAWDIDPFFEEKQEDISGKVRIDIVETGPVRTAAKLSRFWRNSRIVQHIILGANSQRLDFDTKIDWHERHTLLKVSFPVKIQADEARYHIPFGWLSRPTVRNDSITRARFEVSAHYWADVMDDRCGIALLNDCKYGYDVNRTNSGNLMRLTLIKSATLPDPEADQGSHSFCYSLLPHAPNDLGEVWRQSYRLNRPPRIVAGHYALPRQLLPIVDSDGLFVEAVLWSQADDGLVLRLFEPSGTAGEKSLWFLKNISIVFRSNILETDRQPLSLKNGRLTLDCRKFEVITLIVPVRQEMTED